MNVIKSKNVQDCTITITSDKLYKKGKSLWLLMSVLRSIVQEMGQDTYRRLNNNYYAGKYTTENIFGADWINIQEPHVCDVSLRLSFTVVDNE